PLNANVRCMTVAAFDRRPAAPPLLAQPGRNCRCVVRADRLGLAVDGDVYFRALHHALCAARRSVLLIGWEFDSRTRLLRDGQPQAGPNEIGALLDHLVRTNPDLRIHVLIWDSAMIYAFNREFAGLVKMDWLTHRRLRFRLDDSHPLGASHHQKIVVIDDALAFVGGLDVTSQRWDSREHLPDDPRRSDPAYPTYPPFHDIMAVVTGEAARTLAGIARERWFQAAGERLVPPSPGDADRLWPPCLKVQLTGVDVAVSLTCPSWDGAPSVREVEQLYLDMIAAARRFIYIENQYFAARRIADLLARRLETEDCPEIVVINPGEPVSLVERSTMGVARARLLRRLRQADRFGRLHVFYPVVAGEDVKVHAKLMIVDDLWLRVGSANLNNRSMGLDSECDLLAPAMVEHDRLAIRAMRHDLLAEHLGVGPDTVAAAEAATGSLTGAIATLRGRQRTLVPLDDREPAEIVQLLSESSLPDPEEPVETLVYLDQALPGSARRGLRLRTRAMIWLLAVLSVAVTLLPWVTPQGWSYAAALVTGLARLRDQPLAAPLVVGMFLLGGLARVPVSLTVLAAGLVMGAWLGTVLSLIGSLASASFLYAIGAHLGRGQVRRLAGWRVNRVNRALARHGIMAMMLLRLMPVAAFPVVNLVAGASAVKFRDFAAGTTVGMAPGIVALSVLGDRLGVVLRSPSAAGIALLALATALVIAAQIGVVSRLSRARSPAPNRPQ
ncbi:MAG TPA: VTT domain-containing protein, partial [Magnetospirillum sp.]|nr:VTT domain-containing protein [Magnetospirillum sp.]